MVLLLLFSSHIYLAAPTMRRFVRTRHDEQFRFTISAAAIRDINYVFMRYGLYVLFTRTPLIPLERNVRKRKISRRIYSGKRVRVRAHG